MVECTVIPRWASRIPQLRNCWRFGCGSSRWRCRAARLGLNIDPNRAFRAYYGSMAITEAVAGAAGGAHNGRSVRSPPSADLGSLAATLDWPRDEGLLLETHVVGHP